MVTAHWRTRRTSLPSNSAGRLNRGASSDSSAHPAKQDRSDNSTNDGADRHEGEEDEHPALPLETTGLEDVDPGKPDSHAETRPQLHSENQYTAMTIFILYGHPAGATRFGTRHPPISFSPIGRSD
jgi:hypothetical protein